MVLCYFSELKDKNYVESNLIFEVSLENQKLLFTKNILSLIDLKEIFMNKCQKISLIKHFAENTEEKDIAEIAKIINYMMNKSYKYAIFHS